MRFGFAACAAPPKVLFCSHSARKLPQPLPMAYNTASRAVIPHFSASPAIRRIAVSVSGCRFALRICKKSSASCPVMPWVASSASSVSCLVGLAGFGFAAPARLPVSAWPAGAGASAAADACILCFVLVCFVVCFEDPPFSGVVVPPFSGGGAGIFRR